MTKLSDPYGLGELLYALPPADSLVAAGVPFVSLVPDVHDACAVSVFCRNPLHPGPCKGWKGGLGKAAPGALNAIEVARKAKVAERRAKTQAARSVAERGLTSKHHASPLHAKKTIVKKANILLGDDESKASKKADRVILNKTEIKKYSKIKAAQVNGILGDQGIPADTGLEDRIADALVHDNSTGRDTKYRDTLETTANSAGAELARRICQKGDGDCDGKPYEDLREALTEGFRTALASGDDGDLRGLVKKRKDGDLLVPTGANPYVPTAPKAPRVAPPAPAKTPAVPGSAPGNAAMGNASDQALINHIKMHGSTGKGAPAAAELKRRGLDLDGKPLPVAPRQTPPAGAVPKKLTVGEAGIQDGDKVWIYPTPHNWTNSGGQKGVTWRQGTKPGDPQLATVKKITGNNLGRARGVTMYEFRGENGEVLGSGTGSTKNWISPVGEPEFNAPAATPAAQATAMASRTAPGSALAKNHVTAYEALSKDEFDKLPKDVQGKMLADLRAAEAKFLDPKKKQQAQDLLDRFDPKSKHGLEAEQHEALHGATPMDRYKALGRMQNAADNVTKVAAVQATIADMRADTDNPPWLRAFAVSQSVDYLAGVASSRGSVHNAVSVARAPDDGNGWTPTKWKVDDLYDISDSELAKLAPELREAIEVRRNEGVQQILGRSTRQREHADVLKAVLGDDPVMNDNPDLSNYHALHPSVQGHFRNAVGAEVEDNLNGYAADAAASWQHVADLIDGTQYLPDLRAAIDAARKVSMPSTDRVNAIEPLTRSQFQGLPDAHAENILSRLRSLKTAFDPDVRTRSALKVAELEGNMPSYANPLAQQAALMAGVLKDVASDVDRSVAYRSLQKSDFKELSKAGRLAVLQDMEAIANDLTSPLSLATRWHLALKHDAVGDIPHSPEQDRAVAFAAPGAPYGRGDQIAAFDALPKPEYDALMPIYRGTIDSTLEQIKGSDPAAYHRIKAKFDPSYTPPAAPAPMGAVTTSSVPHVQDALNVIYGVDPKAKTGARQLAVYTALPKADFDKLAPHEQQTVAADLAYLATTSKAAATKARAEKLLDRFTPPGTAPGTPGVNNAFYPPANAVAGQVHHADPAGLPGLLAPATGKGASGDGFTRTTSGGKGPWGKFGAAGVMLRHVDQNGTERFLMVERGPGISDPGKWQFPGGAIDSNESAHQGATRETVEELGFKYSDLADARVHGHHETVVPDISGMPNGWRYTSIAATVPTQLKPDLSTSHARAETSDAKWMTRDEIEALDRKGKMLKPLAGGQLQKNVLTLFPTAGSSVARPGPVTQRPPRAKPPAPPSPHKPSIAKNLIPDAAGRDQLSKDIGGNVRKSYRGKSADERLAAINHLQGFDRTPTVKSKKEIDALLATGDYIEVWRGVGPGGGKSAGQVAEEFRTGPDWGGTGVFGNGYYFASDKSLGKAYAGGRNYGGTKHEGLIRALLPKSAAVEKHLDILAEVKAIADGSYRMSNRSTMGGRTLHDEGRFAAAKGLDAILVTKNQYRMGGGHGHLATGPVYVIFNRSTLIVEEEL